MVQKTDNAPIQHFKANRIEYIDLAKGFGIMVVVVYHIYYHLHIRQVIMPISIFMLPLFFFLSGLFFKESSTFTEFLLRKVNKLLIPFVFFYLVTSVVLPNLLYLVGYKVEHAGAVGKISSLWAFISESFSNEPLWFLWAFFLLNIIFYLILVPIKKFTSNPVTISISILVASFTIGFFGTAYLAAPPQCDLPGFVDSAMSSLPFFALGYVLNRHTQILTSNRCDKFLPIIIVACFALAFCFGGSCSYKQNIYTMHPILQYVCGMAGTLGVVFLSKYLGHIPLIAYWGRYSLMILVTHALLLQIYMPIARKFLSGLPQAVMAAIVLVAVMFSYQLLIPLMKRFLPHVTAQKDAIDVSKYVKK